MLIDPFTVGAQIVNFLILVGLLKYFLYGPIVSAMDKREEKIRSRLNDAERKKEEAEAERSGYEKERKEMEDQREKLLEEAEDEAEQRRKKLLRRGPGSGGGPPPPVARGTGAGKGDLHP